MLQNKIDLLTEDLGELHEEHGGSAADRKQAPVMATPAVVVGVGISALSATATQMIYIGGLER
jgi:hypothetical protein